jgi:hypothetical protein
MSVEAYPKGEKTRVRALAVHGGKLITGSCSGWGGGACEVCVRDLKTLALEHVLPQTGASGVHALLADG